MDSGKVKEEPVDDFFPASGSAMQQLPRLEVGDAMAYLERVKARFRNNPASYDRFLEIMKGFKTHTLDTPAVIENVSKLFWNNPDLIMGFNTFLPPGCRIEIKQHNTGFNVGIRLPPFENSGIPVVVAPPVADLINSREEYVVAREPIPFLEMAIKKEPTGTPVIPVVVSTARVTPLVTEPMLHIREVATSRSNLHEYVNTMPPLNVPVAAPSPPPSPQLVQYEKSKPVEFNNAIIYVNKIKRRFYDKPNVYREFLAILNSYQNELKQLTEEEVFSKVAKLFRHHDDLLAEFAIFLPEASSFHSAGRYNFIDSVPSPEAKPPIEVKEVKMSTPKSSTPATSHHRGSSAITEPKSHAASNHNQNQPNIGRSSSTKQVAPTGMKSSASPLIKMETSSHSKNIPPKKRKLFSSETEKEQADNNSQIAEFELMIQKVRRLLRNSEDYQNFLRCLVLYNNKIVSGAELFDLVEPFLRRYQDLMLEFKQMMGKTDDNVGSSPRQDDDVDCDKNKLRERKVEEKYVNIDFSQCERLGTSYCAMPKNYMQPKCRGRTNLCNEVLNDVWICYPVWPEDAAGSPPRRSETEEHIFCIEDQRFELDMVIDSNLSLLKVLETLWKNVSRMSIEQRDKLRLDDSLGGGSPVNNFTAIRRLYGNKAPDVMEGLKLKPAVCLPMVLKRLKDKDKEWRDALKEFNKYWRKQDEDFYLKVLDHPPINYNENDSGEPALNNAETEAVADGIDGISAEALDDEIFAESSADEDDVKTEQNI